MATQGGAATSNTLEKELTMIVNYIRTALALKMDKRAVTAIEYALIAALIAVVIIGAVTTLGGQISKTFNTVASEL
jgi:pilus assembly protein Flp/PilA